MRHDDDLASGRYRDDLDSSGYFGCALMFMCWTALVAAATWWIVAR